MIVFDLQCSNGHRFEGWFKDSQAYEAQVEKSLVACPTCKDKVVSKIPTAFAIKSSQPTRQEAPSRDEMAALGQKLADFVANNFEDVGCDFAREALKIHYGAVEPRNIRGVSTTDEEKTLEEEGVQFFKFPAAPPSEMDS